MKKLTTLLAGAALAGCYGVMGASGPAEASKGLELTESQLHTIQTVHPWIGTENGRGLRHRKAAPNPLLARRPPMGVNPSGSTIEGWRASKAYTEMPSGWYNLATDGEETLLWEYVDPNWVDDGESDPPAFPFSVGFYRNGTMYGFHATTLLNWIVWGYGSFSRTDGTITSWKSYGEDMDLTDFSTYVISCAYNESLDLVYAYTLNSRGDGYVLQTVNPETWQFDVVKEKVNIEDICIGFTYSNEDSRLYGVTPDARFVTMDADNGSLTELARLNLGVTTSVEGMTYSPLDRKFYFVYTVGAYGEDSSTLYSIDPSTYALEEIKTLENAIQYRILMCPDKGKAASTPLAPEIIAIDFPEGATSGTVRLKMPQETYDGSPIEGTLKVKVFVDGKEKTSGEAVAGAVFETAVDNVEEGNRRFSFIVESEGLESAEVDKTIFVGFDTPQAPEGVLLSEGLVKWERPVAGVNGGYVDQESLSYNVYLNGAKLNPSGVEEEEYSFTMPDALYTVYKAEVEAINHGKASEAGASNTIRYGDPYPMPYTMTPTEKDFGLVTFVPSEGSSESTTWRADWDYGDEGNYFFSCYTSGYKSEEEWFFLPPVKTDAGDRLVEVTLEAAVGYDGSDENLELAFGSSQTPEAMTTVEKWKGLTSGSWTTLTARFYAGTDCGYIGVKTTKQPEGYKVKVRNIKVSRSAVSSSTPAPVSGLEATPFPEGELKTTVSFTLPERTMAGETIDGDVTAYVKTSAGEKTVTGTPGSSQTVEIAAVQGYDTLTVATGSKTDGMTSTLRIYTGVDVPAPLSDIKVAHNADYQGFVMEWSAPAIGLNGGYIDPAQVTYALCEYNSETWAWEITEQLGNATSYEYDRDRIDNLEMVELGILTQNGEGHADDLRTVTVCRGKPLSLPLDAVPDENYFSTEMYANMMSEAPSEEYTATWSYVPEISPTFVPVAPLDGQGGYVAAGGEGTRARAALAPFTTEGMESAGLEIQIWSATENDCVAVYAEAADIPCRLIGRFSGASAQAWERHRCHLPAEFMGKPWVSVKVDAEINSDNGSVAFGRYTLKTFRPFDLAVRNFDAPMFPSVTQETTFTARVENAGTETVDTPAVSLTVSKDGNTIAVLPMECTAAGTQVAELGQLTYQATWTPTADYVGNVALEVRIDGDDDDNSNNSVAAEATLIKGNLPLVDNLSGSVVKDGALLTWSDPLLDDGHEGFENYPCFYYGDTTGRFRTFSLDGEDTMCFGNLEFPHDRDPKGWQVFDENEMTIRFLSAGITDGYMTAAEGNRFIAAFVPYTEFMLADLTSDRWIMSPEVKGGSEFSFMLTSGVSMKEENLQVLYSSTDDSPESFTPIDNITLLTAEWRKYSYTLPADARYFAIRYCGNTERGFFVLLDDISYEPKDEAYGTLAGYDIYRDGTLIEDNADARGEWTDTSYPGGSVTYAVTPVYRKDGTLVRGLKSNVVTVDNSGVGMTGTASWRVAGGKGSITLEGLAGRKVAIYSIDGIRCRTLTAQSDREAVEMAEGAYIIVTPEGTVKVMVK